MMLYTVILHKILYCTMFIEFPSWKMNKKMMNKHPKTPSFLHLETSTRAFNVRERARNGNVNVSSRAGSGYLVSVV